MKFFKSEVFSKLKYLFFNNKSVKQTLLKNTVWLGVAEIFTRIINVFVVIWMARYFGPEVYGRWAFALNFVSLFIVLSDFGFTTLTVREISRNKEKTSQYIDNILAMKAALSFFTFIFIAIFAMVLNRDAEITKLIYFLAIYAITGTFASFFQAIFRANEQMQYEAISRIIQSIVLLGLVGFLILSRSSLAAISYAHIVSVLVCILFSLFFIWRYFSRFFIRIDLKICKDIFREAVPFGLGYIALSVYFYVDTVMLGLFKEYQAVGLYNAVYKIAWSAMLFGVVTQNAFLPLLSKSYKNDIIFFKSAFNKFRKITLLLIWPIVVGGIVLAGQIINFLYGDKYLSGIFAFQLLIAAVGINYLVSVYAITLGAADLQKHSLFSAVIGSFVNISLNYILIPVYGVNGAAFVSFLTQIIMLLYLWRRLAKVISVNFFSYNAIPLVASLLMGLVIYFIHFHILIAVLVGMSVYFVSLLIIGKKYELFATE